MTTDAPAAPQTAMMATRDESKPTEIIKTPAEYTAAMRKWGEHYHVLTAFTSVTGLAEGHALIASRVALSPDPSKGGPGDVYDGLPFLKSGEVAIAKTGLRKIADCAGITTRTFRTDPRTIPHYWEVKATASYRGIDGAIIEREQTVEWDLRDGSPRLKGWTKAQIDEARKHGLRACETRAINAAIRELGIKQKYTQDELRKPFLALRCVFQPDLSDPVIKKAVTENYLRGAAQLYAAPAATEIVDAEPVTETAPAAPSTPAATADAAPTPPQAADPDRPPVEGAVRIEKVEMKQGMGRNGKPYKRWTIIDSNGVLHSTFDAKLSSDAEMYRDDRVWVEFVEEDDGQYTNLKAIRVAGQQPALPMDDQL